MFSAIIVSILLILHSNGIDTPFSIVDILIGIPQSKKLFSIKDTNLSILLLNTLKHGHNLKLFLFPAVLQYLHK